MPIDPITAATAATGVVDLGMSVIGDVINVIERVRSKALGEEEGRKLLTAARARLRAADASLDAVLADNDRYIDGLPPLPEPIPGHPISDAAGRIIGLSVDPSPVLTPAALPPSGAVTGAEPSGVE